MSELPGGWSETEIGPVNTYSSETLNPAKAPKQTFELYSVPVFPKRKPEIVDGKDIGSTKQKVEPDDVLLCKINPRINRVWLVGKKNDHEQIASSEWIVIRQPLFHPDFIRFQLQESSFRDRLCAEVSGVGGSLTRAQPKKVESYKLRIAPLAEQKRIAQKLDALLAQVDTLKARIDAIPALLKRFRQSVLAAAVSGQLTEEWRRQIAAAEAPLLPLNTENISLPTNFKRLRKKNFSLANKGFKEPILPETWKIISVASMYECNLLLDFADGNHGSLYPSSADFGISGVPFLTASQMTDRGDIHLHECPMLNESKAVSLIKGWAEDNDVLLSHNATVGRVGILKSTEPVLLGTSVTFYRFNTNYIEPRFMKICFMSEFFQGQLRAMMEQTTRNQVPITAQVSLNALIPPHAEQLEIVRRVEQLFAYADQLEAKVAAAQQRINALTQSLLAKAFRGELVPQDPGDEPASVLLERIRAQRAAAPKPKRGRKATTS
ncbi:restriction endonuclease subunit S [Xanthomonas arboricola]|uniref:restriction endonuclease subunit S n=1 Tax=Xanthomonas arboricola TaxID=56448 RepID=UPI001F49856F|nr:restriction endonuclease subunit S [Xanthomonas arboricola]